VEDEDVDGDENVDGDEDVDVDVDGDVDLEVEEGHPFPKPTAHVHPS